MGDTKQAFCPSCLLYPCSKGLLSLVLPAVSWGHLRAQLFIPYPSLKDPSGGEPSASEEEPTFDPGYEPDWAVISTVRPRPHLAEPRRGE